MIIIFFLIKAMLFSSILSIMKVDLTSGTKYNKLSALNIHINNKFSTKKITVYDFTYL